MTRRSGYGAPASVVVRSPSSAEVPGVGGRCRLDRDRLADEGDRLRRGMGVGRVEVRVEVDQRAALRRLHDQLGGGPAEPLERPLHHAGRQPAEALGLLLGQARLPVERVGVAVLVHVVQVARVPLDRARRRVGAEQEPAHLTRRTDRVGVVGVPGDVAAGLRAGLHTALDVSPRSVVVWHPSPSAAAAGATSENDRSDDRYKQPLHDASSALLARFHESSVRLIVAIRW